MEQNRTIPLYQKSNILSPQSVPFPPFVPIHLIPRREVVPRERDPRWFRTSLTKIARVATIWARHGPECRSINPARHREICHAAENRRGISRVGRALPTGRDKEGDIGVDGKGWRGWWASTSPCKHEGAAALYDASGPRPVFNLSETFWHKTIFAARLSSDDTRSTRPTLLSPCPPRNRVARAATPSVNCQRPNAWKRSMWRDREVFFSFFLFPLEFEKIFSVVNEQRKGN